MPCILNIIKARDSDGHEWRRRPSCRRIKCLVPVPVNDLGHEWRIHEYILQPKEILIESHILVVKKSWNGVTRFMWKTLYIFFISFCALSPSFSLLYHFSCSKKCVTILSIGCFKNILLSSLASLLLILQPLELYLSLLFFVVVKIPIEAKVQHSVLVLHMLLHPGGGGVLCMRFGKKAIVNLYPE